MDPDGEVDVDLSPFLICYKSGRVRRLMGTARLSAGTDAKTGVTTKDVVIDADAGVRARLFVPTDVLGTTAKLPLIVYFHGGLFLLHSAFSPSYTKLVNALVSAARFVAVSVEYRLAPEHPLPAAYDDGWTALCWAVSAASGTGTQVEPWLVEHGDLSRLFVAGDSAGGNISHQLALRAGQNDGGLPGSARIEGMVLLHPFFRGEELLPSERTDRRRLRTSRRFWSVVCAGRYGFDHPFINPLNMPAADWEALGCRRAMVTVAERDDLSGGGRMYAEALRRSATWPGEEVVLYETKGEGHVYFLEKAGGLDRAAKELAAVASFIASASNARRGGGGQSVRSSMGFDAKL